MSLLSIVGAQRELGGVSRGSVLYLIRTGKVETCHVGKRHMILRKSLDEYIERQREAEIEKRLGK